MREIKFRAWDKTNKQMVEFFWIGSMAGMVRNVVQQDPDGAWINLGKPLDYELMQYTGLKDSKGVEIYEGDILATDFNENGMKVGVTKGVVTWDEDNLSYYSKKEEGRGNMLNVYMKDLFEVIGNIYENKDLL